MSSLVVDTDGGADDAAALLIAARNPDLAAVTVCGGVVDVDQAVHNVLVILDVAERGDVPVHRGAHRALAGHPFPDAEEIHGPGGLGGHSHPTSRPPAAEPAADVLGSFLAAGDVCILTLGPFTNLATALARSTPPAPGVRVVAMAGAQDAMGNVTAVAEYNVYCDPEAAAAVVGSGIDVTLVGWDVSRRDAVIGPGELARIRLVGSDRSGFLIEATETLDRFCREVQGLAGFDLPDAAAAAVAMDPGVVARSSRHSVGVETAGMLTRGMTVVDHRRDSSAEANVEVVWGIDHSRFVDLLVAALA